MNEPKKLNICPKAKRCKHGADCINFDVFRGEYLCFEGKAENYCDRYLKKKQREVLTRESKNKG